MSNDSIRTPGQPNEELVTFVLPHAGAVRVTRAEAEQLRIGVELMAKWRETLRALARS